MELLITKADVARILQVAIGYNENEFNNFIREAQDFDLKPLLCEDFYFELLEKKEDTEWKKLIEGGNYNVNRYFRGIGDALAYFTYARFIRKSNNVSTSHGFTVKKTPHSEPISTEEKDKLYWKYMKDANTLFDDFKRYMNGNDEFPSWSGCRDCGGGKKRTGFTTRIIK